MTRRGIIHRAQLPPQSSVHLVFTSLCDLRWLLLGWGPKRGCPTGDAFGDSEALRRASI